MMKINIKKIIIILLLFIPVISFAQQTENQKENKTEEVTEISKTGYVKADGLNIRKEPTTSSEAIHSLSFNSKVKITGEVDGWYRINYNNQVGYVSQKYVSDTKLP